MEQELFTQHDSKMFSDMLTKAPTERLRCMHKEVVQELINRDREEM